MKKFISLILVLAILLCCAACGNGDADNTTSTNPNADPGTSADGGAVALVVGDHDLSVSEMSYFFMDTINQWYGTYGSYAFYLGLDFKKPLGEQTYDAETGETWADCFLDMAVESAKSTYALYDAAQKAGYTLPENEAADVQALYNLMDEYAQDAGYDDSDAYLKAIYGEASDTESYKEYYMVTVIAGSYYSHYAETLRDSYTSEDLRAYEGSTPYNYNSYTYASVYLELDKFLIGGTKGEDGKMVYTDEEIAAAEDRLVSAAGQLSTGDINTVEKLNEAIKVMEQELAQAKGETIEEGKYSTATENKNVLYSKVSSLMQEWLRDGVRVDGNITALPYESTGTGEDGKEVKTLEGYYVILFQECNDNTYPLVDVRHILVAFEGGTTNSATNQKVYSDEEKATAKKGAEELLEQWLAGEATEESFAELANKHSDDGDGTTGGLYEDVFPGQMVTNFNDWCFDESRQAGDSGIVESPYGYHVMFYSGDSDLSYRDYIVSKEKLTKDMESWQIALNDAITVEEKALDQIDINRTIA